MKVNTPKTPAPTRVSQAHSAVKLFRYTATHIARMVSDSPIASPEEKKDIGRALRDVLDALTDLERRTAKVLVRENSEMYKMDDVHIGTRWKAQDQDLQYVVALASTMLEKLFMKRYISEDQYLSLRAYWLQAIVEHDRLQKLWDKTST